jgi:hypothetical protein
MLSLVIALVGSAQAGTVRIESPDTNFGIALATVDVDADGYDDLVVGSAGGNGNIRVFSGGPAGIAVAPSTTVDNPSGVWSWFGHAIADAGDVNGDGYPDVIVGDALAGNPINPVLSNSGAAYVFLGSAAGLATTPSGSVFGAKTQALLGSAVAGLGDVDGDGYGDVAIGASGQGKGLVSVYSGSSTGALTLLARLQGDAQGSGFGGAITAADLNGDGALDLVVGAPSFGGGQGQVTVLDGPAFTTRTAFVGPKAHSGIGSVLGSPGDLDGDGYADVAVGAGESGGTGAHTLQILNGSAGGAVLGASWQLNDDVSSLGSPGDANGDGLADLAVGHVGYDRNAGSGEIWLSGDDGLAPRHAVSPFSNMAYHGGAAAGGDFDGDGLGDVAIGAYGEAAVYVTSGAVELEVAIDGVPVPGAMMDAVVTGASPGDTVRLLGSASGLADGACKLWGAGLCIELASPDPLGTARADANGEARIQVAIPAGDYTLQAFASSQALWYEAASTVPTPL